MSEEVVSGKMVKVGAPFDLADLLSLENLSKQSEDHNPHLFQRT